MPLNELFSYTFHAIYPFFRFTTNLRLFLDRGSWQDSTSGCPCSIEKQTNSNIMGCHCSLFCGLLFWPPPIRVYCFLRCELLIRLINFSYHAAEWKFLARSMVLGSLAKVAGQAFFLISCQLLERGSGIVWFTVHPSQRNQDIVF